MAMELNVVDGAAHSIAEMLREVVRQLVSEPDDVSVVMSSSGVNGNGVIVSVNVAAVDVARVMGRNGVTSEALRKIVFAAGRKHGLSAQMVIAGDVPRGER